MTGAAGPGRWSFPVAGSLLLHAGAAAAMVAWVNAAPREQASAAVEPGFTVSLETLTPTTLAGVQAVRPPPDIVPDTDPPASLPAVEGPEALPPVAATPTQPEPIIPQAAPETAALPAVVATPIRPDPVMPTGPVAALSPIARGAPVAAISGTAVSPVRATVATSPSGGAGPPVGIAGTATAIPLAAISPNVASVTAVPTTSLPPQSGGAGGIADPATPSLQDIAVGTLLDRVAGEPGAPCALALPRRAGAEGAALSLIGTEGAALDVLARAVLTGDLAQTPQTRALVDPRQCPVLDWIRDMPAYPATRLGLRLDATVVDSGTSLTGIVQGVAGRFLTLLLIDDNGVVQDLGPFVTLAGNLARIDAPVARDGPSRDTRQIVLALVTRDPPGELRARLGQVAQAVFTGLPDAMAQGDIALETLDVR